MAMISVARADFFALSPPVLARTIQAGDEFDERLFEEEGNGWAGHGCLRSYGVGLAGACGASVGFEGSPFGGSSSLCARCRWNQK